MNTLWIYDVSSLLYAGTLGYHTTQDVIETDHGSDRLPIGGIIHLMDRVFARIAQHEMIALAFDYHTNKGSIWKGYKGQRNFAADVKIQEKILKEMLPGIGFNTYGVPDTEADDIVYNLVKTNRKDYGHISIVTGDTDLACNILDYTIDIVGSASIYPSISRLTYESVIHKGKFVKYNTVLPYAVLLGKSANNIPPFRGDASGDALYEEYLSFLVANKIPTWAGSEKITFLFWMNNVAHLSESDYTELKSRVEVSFPKVVEGYNFEVRPSSVDSLNKDKLAKFCTLFGLYDQAMIAGVPLGNKVAGSEEKRILSDYVNIYRTGVFNADMSIPQDSSISGLDDFDYAEGFSGNVGEIE